MLSQSPAIARDKIACIASHYMICKLIGLPHCKFQGACPLMLSLLPPCPFLPSCIGAAIPAQLYRHGTARNYKEKKSHIFLVHALTNCAPYPSYHAWQIGTRVI